MPGRLSVLLATEGTYPYHKGGVSTWCHALTRKLADVDFSILAVAMHPYMRRAYELAPNVKGVITVPLWGTEDPAEYGWHESMSAFLHSRWQTTDEIIGSRFVPAYEAFLREATTAPSRARAVAEAVLALHEYFQQFDYQRTMSDRLAWRSFVRIVSAAWERDQPGLPPPAVGELADAWRLLGRLLTVLAAPVPRTDVTHAAAAAFCALPCVVAKLRWGTPYLLTEHGVYVREQYLNLGRSVKSFFVRWFVLRVVGAVTDVSYACADQLSPVCQYNTRWERWRGVDARRIRVIYNGVDPSRFSPPEPGARRPGRPLVVSVGLVFPLKGQLDLIEAAALVRRRVPDLEVRLYGSASDSRYHAECETRIRDLGLQDTVVFAGTTTTPWEVYRDADIVAMSSISEAFPYTVIESMLCGAAIVATDVGGVREALDGAGVLVNARDPEGMAAALTALLEAPQERERLGAAARRRAIEHFTEDRFVEEYRSVYARLAESSAAGVRAARPQRTILTLVGGDGARGDPPAGDGHAVRDASRSRFFFRALKPSATAFSQNLAVPRLYSTTKTALPALTNGVSRLHSLYSKHCSLSAQSKWATRACTWSRSFLRPMERPRA
jgi:glycosyltransferase involved in cell wall biosynthesis